nr:hypothetical protein [Erwinia rhapontici]
MSPLLANMALDGMEGVQMRTFRKIKNDRAKHQLKYIRYVDDFVCSGISREPLENEIKFLIAAFMQKRGLALPEEKSDNAHSRRLRLSGLQRRNTAASC